MTLKSNNTPRTFYVIKNTKHFPQWIKLLYLYLLAYDIGMENSTQFVWICVKNICLCKTEFCILNLTEETVFMLSSIKC